MASGVTFSGVGSGIDFNVIRDAIIAARSGPITQLQNKVTSYNTRVDALRQLNASLAALTTAAQNLTSRTLGTGRTAASADTSVATATAASTASLGQVDLIVTRLATSLTQASRSYSSVDAPVLAAGATSATFQFVKGGAAVQLPPPPVELSAGKTATASSIKNSSFAAANAVDGNASTKWQSQNSSNEWIMVDLGETANISQVELQWDADYAVGYKIQVSNDGVNWTDASTTTTGDGGTDNITNLSATGRYVRMLGTERSNSTGGYMLNEFKVYGTTGPAFTPTNKTITIDQNNNTLTGLRNAINDANAGVRATIVDLSGDGTQQQLVLTSTETGASGRVELIETTSTGTGANINLRSINPTDGDFSKLNAAFRVNGIDLVRSTNTISDAVQGLTFTLKKAGTTSVSVTPSTEITSRLQSFVTAYNAVQDLIAGNYQKDAKGRPTGILASDTTLRSVQQQLRDAVAAISSSNGGSLTNLSEIGITAGQDGKLSFDTAVLNSKLESGSEDVRALLFGKTEAQSGIFQAVYSIADNLSHSTNGTVQNAINGYQNSITNLNNSINMKLEMINRLRESLTRRFSVADAAISQLNGQGTALTNIMKALEPRNK